MKLKHDFFYIKLFKEFYKNFLTDQKKRLIIYFFLSIACIVSECFGIGLLLPVIQCIISPETLTPYLPKFLSDFSHIHLLTILISGSIILILLKDILSIYTYFLLYQIQKTFVYNTHKKLIFLEKNLTYAYFLQIKQEKLQNIHQKFIEDCGHWLACFFNFFTNALITVCILFFLLLKLPIILNLSCILWAAYFFIKKIIYKKIQTTPFNIVKIAQKEKKGFITYFLSYKESTIIHKNPIFLKILHIHFSKIQQMNLHITSIGNCTPYFIECFGITNILLAWYLLSLYLPYKNILQQLLFFSICCIRMLPYYNRLTQAKIQLSYYKTTIQELNQFYSFLLSHQLPTPNKPPITFQHQIRLENVHFSYHNSKEVLHDINLTIQENDFIGIVGQSGQGKTTLIDLLLGLLPPTKGTYFIDNQPITAHNQLAPFFGYVSQTPCIFTGTIAENIAFSSTFDSKEMERVMQLAQLDEFQPNTPIVEMGKNISGGQKQRIAIARALYSHPKILVLDEATASLDAITEEKINNVIQSLKGKCTIIAIAHRLGTLKQCNRLLFMKEGRIDAEGNFETLYQTSSIFKKMVDALERQALLLHPSETNQQI